MATKTLSVDEEAYHILSRARISPNESFSKVIQRASWEKAAPTCGGLLARMTATKETMSDEALDYLEVAQKADAPPLSKWNR